LKKFMPISGEQERGLVGTNGGGGQTICAWDERSAQRGLFLRPIACPAPAACARSRAVPPPTTSAQIDDNVPVASWRPLLTFPLPLLLGLAVAGCAPDAPLTDAGPGPRFVLPQTPYAYTDPELPRHFTTTGLGIGTNNFFYPIKERVPDDNPVTDEGATLGRVLFFDTRLSRNETISCSSCHRPEHGFSDDKALSEGFDGELTGRHSMGLSNARYTGNGRYFWDERAATLEDQVLMPIQDEVEMGMTLDEVVARLEEDPEYLPLFAAAFGDDAVTEQRVSFALAQFVRSLVSCTSRYDQGRAQVTSPRQPFPTFTDEENRGRHLFFNRFFDDGVNCVACHEGETQIAPIATSNGLDAETTDRGVGGAMEDPAFDGVFRVPSLRNIAVRPPYMHDGRFDTLEAVIDHYSDDLQDHPALTVYEDDDGVAEPLLLSADDKAALVAFLNTLTDDVMLSDPRFQDPFIR
jgi:cytochrome c peroxidase